VKSATANNTAADSDAAVAADFSAAGVSTSVDLATVRECAAGPRALNVRDKRNRKGTSKKMLSEHDLKAACRELAEARARLFRSGRTGCGRDFEMADRILTSVEIHLRLYAWNIRDFDHGEVAVYEKEPLCPCLKCKGARANARARKSKKKS